MFHIELKNWLDYSKNAFFSDSKPLAKFLQKKIKFGFGFFIGIDLPLQPNSKRMVP
jgi:hypothetical protein